MTDPSLRTLLRDATASLHARVDALVDGGIADAAGYRRYLCGMHAFLAASGPVLAPRTDLAPLLAVLEDDLRTLGQPPIQPPVVTGTFDGAPSRLGWGYVVAGASVGARQLLRQASALGFVPGAGGGFLAAYAVTPLWQQTLDALGTARFDTAQTIRCRASALAAFTTAEAAFRAAGEHR